MIARLLYELTLILLSILYLPIFLYQMIFKGKYRNSLYRRFGGGFPHIDKGERKLIWIHAVSFGETKAVTPLVKAIKNAYSNPIIIFSSTTETGHIEACRSVPADYHVYLPFDFGWIIRPIIKRTAPDLVILCESDFWFNFLSASKEVGAFVAVVNGKISAKSQCRFAKFWAFGKKIFNCIDLLCVQSKVYNSRFESLGIDREKLVITGNLKFDGEYIILPEPQLSLWRASLSIQPSDRVLVVGSTHSPEEAQIIERLPQIWAEIPNLKVLIVPRHPERFNEVAGLLEKAPVEYKKLSQLEGSQGKGSPQIILVDALGLLRKCYQLADIAVVAGSFFSNVGGHNILEPCWYGVPTLFGPVMYGQPDMVDLVLEYNAGMQVTIDELPTKIIALLKEENQRKRLGECGLRLTADLHGATEKTLAAIKERTSKQRIIV